MHRQALHSGTGSLAELECRGWRQFSGDVELVVIEGMRGKVRFTSQCRSSALAKQAIGDIRKNLMFALNEPALVVHAADEG